MNGEIPGPWWEFSRGGEGAGAGAGGSPGSSLTGGSSPKGILREPAFLSNGVMPIKK